MTDQTGSPTGSAWHALAADEVIKRLNADAQHGLTAAEVEKRIAQYGKNELAEAPKTPFWRRLLAQFQNFVIYILIFATIVSFLLGDTVEAVVIAAIVILNAIIGVIQEGRAEQALESLKKLAAPEARVRRDGKTLLVPGSSIVPGDQVILDAGDYIPADLRLIESANMKIEEASLTGESVAVDKVITPVKTDSSLGDRKNMAYMGTLVTYGRGRGIVTETGMKTEIGKIADILQSTKEEETPLQKRLNELGRTLSISAMVICGVVFVIGALQAFSHGGNLADEIKESFIIAISLAIAAVPEGLPAIVTINLAIGMREMIRRNALIRRLPAVETLGSATAICSDKTGTLTQNQMTAVSLFVDGGRVKITGQGYSPQGTLEYEEEGVERAEATRLLLGGLLSSDARLESAPENTSSGGYRMVGDSTEGALVVAAAKESLWREEVEKRYPRVNEIPFDADRKRMTTIHTTPQTGNAPERKYVIFTKGAPDLVLEHCDTVNVNGESVRLTDDHRRAILDANSAYAGQALRVLAVAQKQVDELPDKITPETIETNLEFLGLVALQDPARAEVKPAIAKARRAGIRTVMVTGDYADTAKAIAAEIGLLRSDAHVISGADLDKMSNADLEKAVEHTDVFARVSPHHKMRIVEAFQARKHVVAMTGDGVNDAPALKRASIGVSMGITGTDVAKGAADMILMDDNYASIVAAVEQGRVIYANIRKFVYFLLTCNLAEIGVIFIGTLLGWGSPLTAIQLLWLNLVTDGAPALALGVEKGDPDVMMRPPRASNEPIINRDMKIGMITQTIIKTLVTLLAFAIGRGFIALPGVVPSLELAETMAFITLAASELARAYTSRSELYSVFKIGLFSNKFMQLAVGTSLVGLLAVVYIPFLQPAFNTSPLNLVEWLVILPLILAPAAVSEITKIYLRRLHDQDDAKVRAAAV